MGGRKKCLQKATHMHTDTRSNGSTQKHSSSLPPPPSIPVLSFPYPSRETFQARYLEKYHPCLLRRAAQYYLPKTLALCGKGEGEPTGFVDFLRDSLPPSTVLELSCTPRGKPFSGAAAHAQTLPVPLSTFLLLFRHAHRPTAPSRGMARGKK
ncbi:hypothetical protein Naga_101164g1 [Nannochloropsis gaditana]|uniref:Uncharacterized protein n=1 Tax=Nannochloropsis gaditana TaxID=72520 RepID=W7TKY0_9STRA|nr:hypothetical protein Naga_101164g1 [Nannochloropsis gaditana]